MMKKLYTLGISILIVLTIITCCSLDNNDSSSSNSSYSSSLETSSQVPSNSIDEDDDTQSSQLENSENETSSQVTGEEKPSIEKVVTPFNIADVPAYNGLAYVAINNNKPFFTDDEITTTSFEKYGNLDSLGRCTITTACVGKDIMPTEDRGNIGQIKPTGWHNVKYDNVDGKYLYNRCHLIGFQLTGENANIKNLITGTRYLNTEGMLPFENIVADYIKETNNHVMYRVTPIFEGSNLLASGVLMEGYSVEDKGQGIQFCVYAYNSQPGININYVTGESSLNTESIKEHNSSVTTKVTYILNTNTKKFHFPSCSSINSINEKNKLEFKGERNEVINQGYSPCGRCHP